MRTWDVGSHFDAAWAGECPPSLEMVFDLMKEKPGSQIYLDLKEVDLEALLKLIQKAASKNASSLFMAIPPCVKSSTPSIPARAP